MTKWCAPNSRSSRPGLLACQTFLGGAGASACQGFLGFRQRRFICAPSALWSRGRLEGSAGTGAFLRGSSSSLDVADFAVDEDDLHVFIVVGLLLTQIGDPNRVAHASDYVCNALAHLDGDWPGGSWRGCNWPGLSEHILLLPVGLLCLLSQLIGGVRLGGR